MNKLPVINQSVMRTTTQILLTLTALAGLTGQAQTTPPAASSPTEDWIKKVKKPADWLSWGADLRLRDEYFENARTLDPAAAGHDQNYLRFRARIWATLSAFDNLDFNVRLTAEQRVWTKKSFSPYFMHQPLTSPAPNHPDKRGWDSAEGIIDNLNVKWKNMFDQPMSLTFGRQDIMLGDGWLVGDGTPGDGSRTFYFDALRYSLELKDCATTIDAIGIYQDGMNDMWLPPLNHINKLQTDQDEVGGILWVGNKSIKELNLDGYFMYKHDLRRPSPLNNLLSNKGDDAELYTLGGRLSGLVGDHWQYRFEGAYQWGHKNDPGTPIDSFSPPNQLGYGKHPVSAYGLNSRLSYLVKDKLNNQAHFSFEYLSGDKKGTTTDEMFDSLWGRWPQWSELYIYSYVNETRMAQTANLIRFGPGWSIAPTKKMNFSTHYFALFADQSEPTRPTGGAVGLFSKTGDFRGHYLQSILRYKFNDHMAGHLWTEFLWPGDFYVKHERMSFLRAELMLTF
jgi:hypothetical protein